MTKAPVPADGLGDGNGLGVGTGRVCRAGCGDVGVVLEPADEVEPEEGNEDGRRHEGERLEVGVHGDVPPGEAPRGPLGLAGDPVRDRVDDAVGGLRGTVAEPGVEEPFDIAFVRHAERPFFVTTRASASRAARMARWAWWSRDRAVPAGIPSVSAISVGAYPRKWCRTRIARCSGGSRRNPRSSWSRSATESRSSEAAGPSTGSSPQVRGAATLARRLGDADTDEEAGQPRIEPVRIAEVPEVTPGDHQRVLQGVLGPVDVTEDPLGDREQAVAAHADQVDECRLVAVLCCRQELAIHSWASAGVRLGGRIPTLLGGRASAAFNLHAPASGRSDTRTWSRRRSDGRVTPAIASARSISSR